MFTRKSNFTYGNYVISNIDTTAANSDTALAIHIQKYEPECLRMILGERLYAELMTNLETDTDGYYRVKATADEKWRLLVNGTSYEPSETYQSCYCGCAETCDKHTWDGLIRKVATVQEKDVYETIMAPYLFYWWSLHNRTLVTGIGEGKGKSNGMTPVSTKERRADAWNEFVQAVSFGYPGGRVSLRVFLLEHAGLFPEYHPVCLKTQTYYDI